MEEFELTNEQREFFGLDPIVDTWERVVFAGDTYRPESVLYFDGLTIKRHIVTTSDEYSEKHLDELTRDRSMLIPKTSRGKEKKLTAATLEQRTPHGVYLSVNRSRGLKVGSYASQTTFYSSDWARQVAGDEDPPSLIHDFIQSSPPKHFDEIRKFKALKRKHVRFKAGDYFCLKLNRTEYGFGRVLLDIHKIRKKGFVPKVHGFNLIMMMPVVVQLFAFKSEKKEVDISTLVDQPKLPSDTMADNLLLYGEYEIIGHRDLVESDFEFPISYRESIDRRRLVFLQWGLIHRELPVEKFDKYLGRDIVHKNPFGYYSIGFRPHYDTVDVLNTIRNGGVFSFDECYKYNAANDLRNPKNDVIRRDIFVAFGLDPDATYEENCRLTKTAGTVETIRLLG